MSADTHNAEVETAGINVTPAAVKKAKELMASAEEQNLALRLGVQPGGCAGLSYQLSLDNTELDGDIRKEIDGLVVVTDPASAPYLDGATVDYTETIEKMGFTIDNPNAKSGCSCGDSFGC